MRIAQYDIRNTKDERSEAMSVLLVGINSAIFEIATVAYGNLAMTRRNALH